MDFSSIIKNNHWSDLLLALGQYENDQYQFALSTTYQQFWETCPKGEWLLFWIAKEGNTDSKLIVHAGCQCVRLALPYCKDKKQRPLKAIEATEKWIRGEATLEEVKQARVTASAVVSASSAAASSASAAAITSATYFAATAAYHVSSESEDTRQKTQLQTADLVRSLIPMPTKLVDEYEHILKLKAFL